jgi:acetyl esterase/lipase
MERWMKPAVRAACAVAVFVVSLAGLPAFAAEPPSIPLYAKGTLAPSSIRERADDLFKTGRIVRNVSEPTITAYLPPPGKSNGAAVIVAPGGGFLMLSYDLEGVFVAEKLAQEGFTAFVLKYRLTETPDEPATFLANIGKLLPRSRNPNDLPDPPAAEALATEDARVAIRLVRARAAKWSVDPKRVGFVGFSAGGLVATNISIGEPSGRPDFVGVIYAFVRGPVPADAPPAFMAVAGDDGLVSNGVLPMYNAWRAAGRPAELHIYERGGHGFGYGLPARGMTSDHWLTEFVWWTQYRGLTKPTTPPR